MAEASQLESWSAGLLLEIFEDRDGNGRPVTAIYIDEDVLSRAALKGGVELKGVARDAFLAAFPSRAIVVQWLSGTSDPGKKMVAFLMLCCFAAGEAADLEANDYRKRIADLLQWSEPVVNCGELPKLWQRLEWQVKNDKRLRPFVLPSPGFRTIIGHAIELAFPARPDATKLRTLLDSRVVDVEKPSEVIAFLHTYISAKRFTSSFNDAFNLFSQAWRTGHRALADDRFWVGWQLVSRGEQAATSEYLKIVADEWGELRVADIQGKPEDISVWVGSHTRSRELESVIKAGHPILLAEDGWGQWRWAGSDKSAKRNAIAALIFDRAYGPRRIELFDRQTVKGAHGWSFTTALDLLLSSDERNPRGDDLIFDPYVRGIARVDGGYLCRQSFPLSIIANAHLKRVELVSNEGLAAVVEMTYDQASIGLLSPISKDFSAVIQSAATNEVVHRTLRFRASAIAPKFQVAPGRLTLDDDEFCATTTDLPCASLPFCKTGETPDAYIRDLIELFACRTSPIAMGELLSLLRNAKNNTILNNWDIVQSLLDAQILRSYRNTGWGGRSVLAVEPSGALRVSEAGWTLVLEGLVNETLAHRLQGAAAGAEIIYDEAAGGTPWAPPTVTLTCTDLATLQTFADHFELRVFYCRLNTVGAVPLHAVTPNANGRNHLLRNDMPLPKGLRDRGLSLVLCERERNDSPKIWLVKSDGGLERFWATRNQAMIDIHLSLAEPAFRFDNENLVSHANGCRLPTGFARWLRMLAGVAGGPLSDGRYIYPVTNYSREQLKLYLGSLLETPSVENLMQQTQRQRAPTRSRLMARPGDHGPITIEPWRWARYGRRV